MTNQNKKSIWTIENFSFALITIGILIAISTFFLFIIGEDFSTSSNPIKADKFAQYGDTIGGVVGSLWALAGVLLFYAAFRKQIEALEDQKEATKTTQKAIELQSKELELQREELRQTREVFKEQEKTLKVQQFESTFFNLLDLYNSLISNMDIEGPGNSIYSNRDFFNRLFVEMYSSIRSLRHPSHEDIYKEYYFKYETDLEPYYKLLKQLLIRIDNCPFENKQEYLDILASQISSKERELIVYFEKAERLDVELLRLLKKYKIIGEG